MKNRKERLALLPAYANGEEIMFIMDALRNEAFGHSGYQLEKFTEELGEFLSIEGIRLVSNAPSALHLVCRLAGIEKGDIVFSSVSMSIELAEPVLELGAELVLIDSEPVSWNMSPQALERALKEGVTYDRLPKMVIVSHAYGRSAKIDQICSLCKQYGVMVVEDACEALGTLYQGKLCGTWGEFGIFSFESDKMITTSSGGMLVSSQFSKLGEELSKAFLNYPTFEMGYTYSMSNILAGMGRAQLHELEERIKNKQKIFNLYKRTLSLLPGISFPRDMEHNMPNRWLTTILIEEREAGIKADTVVAELSQLGIEATLLKKPLHLYLSLKNCRLFSHSPGRNTAELLYKQGIALPSGAFMTPEEQFQVIVAFRNIYQMKKEAMH